MSGLTGLTVTNGSTSLLAYSVPLAGVPSHPGANGVGAETAYRNGALGRAGIGRVRTGGASADAAADRDAGAEADAATAAREFEAATAAGSACGAGAQAASKQTTPIEAPDRALKRT
jgi:hypothetical protein